MRNVWLDVSVIRKDFPIGCEVVTYAGTTGTVVGYNTGGSDWFYWYGWVIEVEDEDGGKAGYGPELLARS